MKLNWKQLDLPLIPKISFKKVFDAWESWAANDAHPRQQEAIALLKDIGGIQALREPFEELSILTRYEQEISRLLSNLFPEALQKNEIKAASLPFQPFFFCATERFRNIVENAGTDYEFAMRGITEEYFYFSAASFYLAAGLGVPLNLSRPQIFDIPDKENGIIRTYRGFFNADFSEFHRTENSPELSAEQIALLLNNSEDLELWKRLIP
ncbi:MAG: hypothetical protein KTR24_18385, partial [Saprospiraceae bacterium]|nr:hypothetical protein [Saprospiraceae bacterium]